MSFDTPVIPNSPATTTTFKSAYNPDIKTNLQPISNKREQSNTLIDELAYPALFPNDSPNLIQRQLHTDNTYNILSGTTQNSDSTITRRLTHSNSQNFEQLPGLEPLNATPRSSNESTPSSSIATSSLSNSPNLFVPWRLSPLTYNKQLLQTPYNTMNNNTTQQGNSPLLLDRFTSYQSNNSGLNALNNAALQTQAHVVKSEPNTTDALQPTGIAPTVKRDSSFQSTAFGLGSPRLLSRGIGSIPTSVNPQLSPELSQLHQQRNTLHSQRAAYGFTAPNSNNPSPSPTTHSVGLQPLNKTLNVATNKLANTVMSQNANVKPEQLQQWREMHSSTDKSPTSVTTDDTNVMYNSHNKHNVVKQGSARVTPHTGPITGSIGNINDVDTASRSSTPTGKHPRDRSVKAAMRISIDHKDNSIVLEVIDKQYVRPHCDQDPPVAPFKIRLIKITNVQTNKVDVYVHAADIGGVVERKSNISRLFGQFDSPTEKLLMSVSGAHNHSIGQESNILTYQGVLAFFQQKKMKQQPHYKHWIETEILPAMQQLATSTQPGNATPILAPKDKYGDSDEDEHTDRRSRSNKRTKKMQQKNAELQQQLQQQQMLHQQQLQQLQYQQHTQQRQPSQSIQPPPPPSQPSSQQSQTSQQPPYQSIQPMQPYFQPYTVPGRPSPTIYHRQLHQIPQTSDYSQQPYAIPYQQSYMSQYSTYSPYNVPPPSVGHTVLSGDQEDYAKSMAALQHQSSVNNGLHAPYNNSPYAGATMYAAQPVQPMQSPLMPRY